MPGKPPESMTGWQLAAQTVALLAIATIVLLLVGVDPLDEKFFIPAYLIAGALIATVLISKQFLAALEGDRFAPSGRTLAILGFDVFSLAMVASFKVTGRQPGHLYALSALVAILVLLSGITDAARWVIMLLKRRAN